MSIEKEFLKERLALVETQHSDLMDLWESAKDQWLDEEDPATKENLRVVYDDVMSMVEKTGTRLVQLEASLCGNGGDSDVTVGSKRLRGEGITLPRRGLPPVSNPYGSAPMMGRPASMCAPPTIVAPPSSKAPGSAPIRHMMQD